MKRLAIIVLLIFQIFQSLGQRELVIVSGKVLNGNTLKPVPYVFVINVNKNLGTKTDTAGRFRIVIEKTDSLRFSSLGFESYVWKPKAEEIVNGKIKPVIILRPKDYMLSNVDIYRARWLAFVNDVSKTKIEKDETQERIYLWIKNTLAKEDLATRTRLARGTGILIPLPTHTKRERELRKLRKLQQEKLRYEQVHKKFNREIVAKITGLSGKQLDDFMKYCNFDDDFILQTNEYDLIVIIQDMFEEYKEMKGIK